MSAGDFHEEWEARREHERRLEELRREAGRRDGAASRRSGPAANLTALVLLPLGIAAVCAAIWGLFYWATAQESRTPEEWVQRIRNSSGYERRWALMNLAVALREDERARQRPELVVHLADFYETIPDDTAQESLDLKKYTLQALGLLGRREAVPALERWLHEETDPGVLGYVLEALGMIGDRSALPAMRPFLSHPAPFVRKYAIRWIAPFGEESDREEIARRLEDDTQDVRWNAAIALAYHYRDARAAETLARLLDREYVSKATDVPRDARPNFHHEIVSDTLFAACRAAGRLGDPEFGERLRVLLRDPSEKVRRAAGEALRELEDRSS